MEGHMYLSRFLLQIIVVHLQGGLEIACNVVVKMQATVKNHMLVDRYSELANERYVEPKKK